MSQDPKPSRSMDDLFADFYTPKPEQALDVVPGKSPSQLVAESAAAHIKNLCMCKRCVELALARLLTQGKP